MLKTDTEIIARLVQEILPIVPFDGWSAVSFDGAVASSGTDRKTADRLCPRGAVDLAVAAHRSGDDALAGEMGDQDLEGLRYSEKVALAIETRLRLAGDKETVRRATSLFALPHMAVEGAGLVWGTADTIWNVLGDTSDDINWYSKRAILASVYGSAVLYWLGDTSGGADTRAYIDRRIANVMQFEKFKAGARKSPVFGPLAQGFEKLTQNITAPKNNHRAQFPGYQTKQETR